MSIKHVMDFEVKVITKSSFFLMILSGPSIVNLRPSTETNQEANFLKYIIMFGIIVVSYSCS